MTKNRDDILSKIANLRARTEDAGASEAEAEAAMKMAEKLMTAYAVDEAELALAESEGRIEWEIVTERSDVNLSVGRNRHKAQMALPGIEALCEVEAVIHCRWNQPDTVSFTGDKPDVAMADYLLGVCKTALDREYARWKRTQRAVGRGAKGSFQTAMAARLSHRMTSMARERDGERKAKAAESAKALGVDETVNAAEMLRAAGKRAGTALVVLDAAERKREEVETAFRAEFPSLRSAAGFSGGRNGNAASAGRAAAERVGLGRPVGGSSAAGAISAS